MKLKAAFLITFILGVNYLFSQNFNRFPNWGDVEKFDIIDQATLKCSYKLTYLKNADKPNNISTDQQTLLVGKQVTHYFSQYAFDYNTFSTKRKNEDAIPTIKEKGAWSFEVYRNLPKGKLTIIDIGSMLQRDFLYEEDFPVFDWKVTDDTLTVLGYTCRKATTHFRGRDFIAWFTTEIPLTYGPWKFGGLPGLIMKLNDTQNNFVYVCNGIQKLNKPESIRFFKVNYVKLSRETLSKQYKRFHANPGLYLNSTDAKVKVRDPSKYPAIPYNPIELK